MQEVTRSCSILRIAATRRAGRSTAYDRKLPVRPRGCVRGDQGTSRAARDNHGCCRDVWAALEEQKRPGTIGTTSTPFRNGRSVADHG